MAGAAGALVVSLGLNAAEYTQGLTKAEYQAQQFSSRVRSSILEVGKVLGSLAIGNELFNQTKDIIASAAALDDLSDATGSSVENLSRLANQAKISGRDFESLQTLVLKLAAGMAGIDDQSSKASKALAFLGITTKDPVQALQEVAVKLNQYADGVGKAGIAVQLFGRQGPAFLATLKDIAELQDVVGTTTAKQAAEAEALEKAYRRLGAEATGFKNAILTDLVPALLASIEQFSEGTKIAGGFLEALRLFAGINPFQSVQENITALNAQLQTLKSDQAGDEGFSKFINNLFGKSFDGAISDATKKIEFLKFQQRQSALRLIDPSNNDARDFQAQQKPQLKFVPEAKEIRESVNAAQKYLESLQHQLDRTQELTAVELALKEIQSGRLKGLTPAIKEQILGIAEQIDAYKELEKWQKESKKAFDDEIKAQEDAASKREKIVESLQHETDGIIAANEQLRVEILTIVGGQDAHDRYVKSRIDGAIAVKELALAEAQLDPLRAREVIELEGQITALKERNQLLTDKSVAEAVAKQLKDVQDFRDALSGAFVNSFEGFIEGTKSAKSAFLDFAKDIEKMLVKLALSSLGDKLFGGKTAGGAADNIFGSLLGALGIGGGGKGAEAATGAVALSGSAGVLTASGASLAASAAALTAAAAALSASAAASAIGGAADGLSGLFGSALGGLAQGGGLAGGTDFWRGGRTWVGENGPELVNLPRGASVTTSENSRRMAGATVNQTLNIPANVDSRSIRQIRNAARDGVMRASWDR